MSQGDVGVAIDRTRASVSSIESGRQHPPLHTLYNIAHALRVDINELLPSNNESESDITALREQRVRESDIEALFPKEVTHAASTKVANRAQGRGAAT